MLNFFRNFFFINVSPLVKKGQEKILDFDDLLDASEDLLPDRSLLVIPIDQSSPKKFLLQILWEQKALVKKAWLFYLLGTLTTLSTPLLVNLFITRLTELSQNHLLGLGHAIPISLVIGLIGILIGIGYQHNFYGVLRANLKIAARLNRLIFEKALKLSQKARQNINIGDVVNHMSSDSEAIAELPMLLGDTGWAIILLVGSIVMLFYYLGWTALVAVVILLLLSPLTKKIAKNFVHLEDEMMKKRDARVTLMGQILQSMRLVKYFVWEKEITSQVAVVRGQEVDARTSLAKTEVMSELSFVAVSTLVLFIALWSHVLRGETLTPALVLTCVSLFGLLQEPIGHLPSAMSRLTNAWVSSKRLIEFLSAETVLIEKVENSKLETHNIIHFENLTYKSDNDSFVLNDLNFALKKGSSTAIVGEVGSGKTTLLQIILGEMKPASGNILVGSDHFGYVSQESYIMNASVLENLKMGRTDLSDKDIELALNLTAMDRDIKSLPGGLLTEIGEKGVNLSGGQKQRISLGRCFLQDPALVLLDDPLSAVDVHTENFLVKNLIMGAWSNKTRVVTTHRLESLGLFDRILFLKDGKIAADGTLDELLKTSSDFQYFFSHHQDIHAHEKNHSENSDVKNLPDEKVQVKIMSDEDREQGAVKGSLYWDYVRALGGDGKNQKFVIGILLAGIICVSIFPLLSRWWLSWFSAHPENVTPIRGIMVYGAISLFSLLIQMANKNFWLKRGIRAGVELHDNMLSCILRAPVRFFDSTPVGRLLQRFSRDLEAVDTQLQWNFEAAVQCLIQIVVALALIIFSVPIVLVVIIPVGIFYWKLQAAYRASAREVKRIDSIKRSPRFAHFKETLGGLPVIRAYKKEVWFREQFFGFLEESQKASLNNFLLNRWFSFRIPLIGGVVSGATSLALSISVYRGMITAPTSGLVIIYSMSFWQALNWGVRIFSELESRMTSIERIRFMTKIPSEKIITTDYKTDVDKNWPTHGHIKFSNVHARYDETLPEVVKGLSVEIPSFAQVGIVGRTGAGKTTLFQMIYRFINIHQGKIEIDGVDIASVPLQTLRERLAIIPQDPTLFMGTLRSNLDPYARKSDDEIWKVLEVTGLLDLVKNYPLGFLSMISDGGANLSQGQRQLFCLARALLLDAKIIMLDEATASVDVVSDAKIQRVLRSELKNKTVLVIAHRLGTVADLDYLMVMNDGCLESFKKPSQVTLNSEELGLVTA